MKFNNSKVKKFFLFLSIIPYILFLILGIINCISSSIQLKYLDLYALIEPIDNFWLDYLLNNILSFNLLIICLTLFCIAYPIYYYINYCDKKDVPNDKIIFNKSFILYLLSFIPYLFVAYFCIFGLYNIFIPIIPALLIFQIIYSIKKYKSFNRKMKRLVIGIILSILLLIIMPCLIYGIK